MIGNILINLIFGLIGFIFTLLVNLGNNLLMTSFIRSIMGFIIWFVLAFLLRWVLGSIVQQNLPPIASDFNHEVGDEELGSQLDISTPNEDEELINLLKPQPGLGSGKSEGFTPLQPPKLVSLKDPEELAKAVRHLKEE
ncbi:hypothetical protein [Paenibacillus monticola]|uniref:Uncharacterized protein n=1 Tax=Paenibacillus monticola TaxID=2666075 RepID=A0A7X2H7A6_9BACL|nr:hypothetical protein [Paenibacillus monticola]MRN54842.1 hypothetical protein [Paenibacillus monticola]